MIKELNKNQLYKNWEVKRLGDVCSFHNGKGHEKSIDENGRYKVVNSKFVSSNGMKAKRTAIAKFPLLKEDIVMVMSDVPNGKTLAKCFYIDKDDEYSLNQRVCAFRTTSFDKDFLFYQLNRNKYFLDFNNGENQSNLRKGDILDCPLLIPPLDQQKQIVATLDKAFATIDTATANAKQNLQNAKEFFESYLQNVFENKGDDWDRKKLQDVCHKISDGTHQTPKYFDEGVIFLSSRNVTSGKINWDKIKYIDEKQHIEMHKHIAPRIDDILLAKNGTTGVAAIVDRDVVFDIYVSLAHIRSLGDVYPQFLLYFINSTVAKKQFNSRLKGAGVPNLHLKEIREVVIDFPNSIEEQKKIVSKLDTISIETKKLEAIYTKKLADLEEMKKSVLQKAFAGQLKTIN